MFNMQLPLYKTKSYTILNNLLAKDLLFIMKKYVDKKLLLYLTHK